MLIIIHTHRLDKRLEKVSAKMQSKVAERVDMFIADKHNKLLDNHPLHGEYDGCISINITGDLRLILKEISNDKYLAIDFGTHSQLYE